MTMTNEIRKLLDDRLWETKQSIEKKQDKIKEELREEVRRISKKNGIQVDKYVNAVPDKKHPRYKEYSRLDAVIDKATRLKESAQMQLAFAGKENEELKMIFEDFSRKLGELLSSPHL